MLKPLFTEKSLIEAQKGRFTFKVDRDQSKYQVKEVMQAAFNNSPPNLPSIVTDIENIYAGTNFYPVPANKEITVGEAAVRLGTEQEVVLVKRASEPTPRLRRGGGVFLLAGASK